MATRQNSTTTLSDTKAGEVSDLLKVVATPNRLRILCLIHEGEQSVTGIEQALGIRQPTLSQQLGELREAHRGSTRREHKTVFYSRTDERVLALLAALYGIFFCAQDRSIVRRCSPARIGVRLSIQAAMFGIVGKAPS